jgi:hypothetical protein
VHHHDHHHHHHRPRQQSTTSSVVAHVTAPSTAGYARALPNTRSSVSFISPGLEQQVCQSFGRGKLLRHQAVQCLLAPLTAFLYVSLCRCWERGS